MLWKSNAIFLHDVVLQIPELRVPLLLLSVVLLHGDVDNRARGRPGREQEGRKLYEMRPLTE